MSPESTPSPSAITFAIIGGGWRTEFYLRIARAMPDRFRIAGLAVRNEERAAALADLWGVPVFPDLDAMLAKTDPSFVVTAVSWAANPGFLRLLAERGIPALSETPPAPDLPGLLEVNRLTASGARIQIAEQYHAQPHHAALLGYLRLGRIGRPSQAQVSVGHGYHGLSLIRRFLGLDCESPTITGLQFTSPILSGGGREGPPTARTIRPSTESFFWFDFGDRLGLLDFTGDQYFGWIRNTRLLIRGDRGEITGDRAFYLKDHATPIEIPFVRRTAGIGSNLEGNHLQGYLAGDEWIYHNPCAPASLADDEIAIATCLLRMDEYVRTGKDFYPLAEGSQDHYLYLLAQQSVRENRPIQAERQPWAF
jgi:predicted dehydrogenase